MTIKLTKSVHIFLFLISLIVISCSDSKQNRITTENVGTEETVIHEEQFIPTLNSLELNFSNEGEEFYSGNYLMESFDFQIFPKYNQMYIKFDDEQDYYSLAPALSLANMIIENLSPQWGVRSKVWTKEEAMSRMSYLKNDIFPFLTDPPTSFKQIKDDKWREYVSKLYYDKIRNREWPNYKRVYGEHQYGNVIMTRNKSNDNKDGAIVVKGTFSALIE